MRHSYHLAKILRAQATRSQLKRSASQRAHRELAPNDVAGKVPVRSLRVSSEDRRTPVRGQRVAVCVGVIRNSTFFREHCAIDAYCTNTVGGFLCACHTGHEGTERRARTSMSASSARLTVTPMPVAPKQRETSRVLATPATKVTASRALASMSAPSGRVSVTPMLSAPTQLEASRVLATGGGFLLRRSCPLWLHSSWNATRGPCGTVKNERCDRETHAHGVGDGGPRGSEHSGPS